MHARKVPERPYFNLVTLVEKVRRARSPLALAFQLLNVQGSELMPLRACSQMPWAYPQFYNSAAVVRMFKTACAAIEILATVKRTVVEWQDILAVLVRLALCNLQADSPPASVR